MNSFTIFTMVNSNPYYIGNRVVMVRREQEKANSTFVRRIIILEVKSSVHFYKMEPAAVE